MMNVMELRLPISEEQPGGLDLSTKDRFAEVERCLHDAMTIPSVGPDGVPRVAPGSWTEVVDRSTAFLTESRNLKVGAVLTLALFHKEGVEGLSEGLELIVSWLSDGWDWVYPRSDARLAVLTWMGSDSFHPGLQLAPLVDAAGSRLVPLTEEGFREAEYLAWLKFDEAAREQSEDPDDARIAFDRAFADTRADWYDRQIIGVSRCEQALKTIDDEVIARWAPMTLRDWGYVSHFERSGERKAKSTFAKKLKNLREALTYLRSLKPEPLPNSDPPTLTNGDDRLVASGVSSPPNLGNRDGSARNGQVSSLPQLLRTMREESSHDPIPYLIARAWRWGEILRTGGGLDLRLLEAPESDSRVRLRQLFLAGEWLDLLRAAEDVMLTPAGRGWLDIQRYSVLAASELGVEFVPVRNAISTALTGILNLLPDLVSAALMDGLPGTSPETSEWLELGGYILGEDRPETSDGEGEFAKPLRQCLARAEAMARSGSNSDAIRLLTARADREASARGRFLVRAKAAEFMVANGHNGVARHILEELEKVVTERQLKDWEAGSVVAHPLGLLHACLEESDPNRGGLLKRIARLDPLLALRIEAGGPRPNGGALRPSPSDRPLEPSNETSTNE